MILDFSLYTDPRSLWEMCPSPHSLWVSVSWGRERELPPFLITSRTLSRVEIETCKTSALPKGMMSNFLIYPPLPLPFPPKKKKRRRTHPKSNLFFWSKHLDEPEMKDWANISNAYIFPFFAFLLFYFLPPYWFQQDFCHNHDEAAWNWWGLWISSLSHPNYIGVIQLANI